MKKFRIRTSISIFSDTMYGELAELKVSVDVSYIEKLLSPDTGFVGALLLVM